VPTSFGVSNEGTLASFVERYGFATLISGSAGELVASHIPIMLQRSGGKLILVGHVARANAQWEHPTVQNPKAQASSPQRAS